MLPRDVAVADDRFVVNYFRLSQDGRLLVTGSNDNTIRVWDVATGKPLKILRGHAGRVPACVFCGGSEGEQELQ